MDELDEVYAYGSGNISFDAWMDVREQRQLLAGDALSTDIGLISHHRGDFMAWWKEVTGLAREHLDFKSQYITFLEEQYFPRVNMINRDRVLFLCDVLWDLEVAE